ncbi:hypothetical protein B0H13DRAFT_2005127 [Mycena leptocephala]|nr:hypothetical protein B0H13DRAFT_2005127 [Mycena leptocephala]
MSEQFWEENNSAVKYSSGKWARSYGSIYHGSSIMRTRQLGDSMSVKFQGSAIGFMGAQGWDHGSFLVNLDGEETTVDGYCCGPNGGVPQVIQFEATGLDTSEHILNLAAGPSGTVLEVDALIITSHTYTSYLPFAMFLVFLAFIVAFVRRRPGRLASSMYTQMLPLASTAQSLPEHIPTAPVQGPGPLNSARRDKGAYSQELYSTAGASGSGTGQNLPPYYAPADGAAPHVDDELVDRIAQRLARLVHNDPPPTYETTTAS